jgi:hypothetical protein
MPMLASSDSLELNGMVRPVFALAQMVCRQMGLTLALLVALTLAACGGGSGSGTPAEATGLTAPVLESAVSFETGVVSVSWSGGAGAASFQVQWSDDPNFAAGTVNAMTTAADSTSARAESLTPGKSYYFRVSALDASGKSMASASALRAQPTSSSLVLKPGVVILQDEAVGLKLQSSEAGALNFARTGSFPLPSSGEYLTGPTGNRDRYFIKVLGAETKGDGTIRVSGKMVALNELFQSGRVLFSMALADSATKSTANTDRAERPLAFLPSECGQPKVSPELSTQKIEPTLDGDINIADLGTARVSGKLIVDWSMSGAVNLTLSNGRCTKTLVNKELKSKMIIIPVFGAPVPFVIGGGLEVLLQSELSITGSHQTLTWPITFSASDVSEVGFIVNKDGAESVAKFNLQTAFDTQLPKPTSTGSAVYMAGPVFQIYITAGVGVEIVGFDVSYSGRIAEFGARTGIKATAASSEATRVSKDMPQFHLDSGWTGLGVDIFGKIILAPVLVKVFGLDPEYELSKPIADKALVMLAKPRVALNEIFVKSDENGQDTHQVQVNIGDEPSANIPYEKLVQLNENTLDWHFYPAKPDGIGETRGMRSLIFETTKQGCIQASGFDHVLGPGAIRYSEPLPFGPPTNFDFQKNGIPNTEFEGFLVKPSPGILWNRNSNGGFLEDYPVIKDGGIFFFGHFISIERTDGSPFDLNSVDYALGLEQPVISENLGLRNLRVNATRADGSFFVKEFTLDPMQNNAERKPDPWDRDKPVFKTITFGKEFISVISVGLTHGVFLDNLNIEYSGGWRQAVYYDNIKVSKSCKAIPKGLPN